MKPICPHCYADILFRDPTCWLCRRPLGAAAAVARLPAATQQAPRLEQRPLQQPAAEPLSRACDLEREWDNTGLSAVWAVIVLMLGSWQLLKLPDGRIAIPGFAVAALAVLVLPMLVAAAFLIERYRLRQQEAPAPAWFTGLAWFFRAVVMIPSIVAGGFLYLCFWTLATFHFC